MTSKPYRLLSARDRLKKHQTNIKELEAQFRNRNTPRAVATTATAGVSAAGETGGTGNFLPTSGGTMNGPLALNPPVDFTVDIDGSNTIDIGESSSNSQYSSNIQIEDVPTSTTLDIIKGAAFDGQILIIRTFAPNPITVSQGTLVNGGNIQTGDSNDFVLGDLQIMILIFDESLKIEANVGGSWRVLSVSSGGGGDGFTDPLTQLLITLSTATLPATTTIDTNTATEFQITLDENIEFDFIGGPANNRDQVLTLFILQNGTGGFTIDWGTKVTNPPEIGLAPNESSTVVLVSRNQGTSWTVESATSGGGGSSFSGNLSDLVIDTNLNMLNQDILGVKNLDFDDPLSTISGLVNLEFFQAGQSINSLPTGIDYKSDSLQKHSFNIGGVEVLQIEEAAAGVYRIDMLNHSVKDAQDYTLDTSALFAIAGTSPAFAYDSANNRVILNHPTGDAIYVFENATIGTTIFKTNSLESNIITANDLLQLGVSVTAPTFPGEFRSDGTDVKVFSGGTERNLSNIGAGSPLTTKGDIFTFDTVNARLPVGSNGQVLTANSAVSLGVEWAVGGGGGEFFGPWTALHDAGIQSLTNLALVQLVDSGGTIRGSISGDLGAAAVRLSTISGGKFIISDVITDIVEFDDTTGLKMLGTHVINMGNNVINTIKELQFDNSNVFSPTVQNVIGFDGFTNALKYNVALTTDIHSFHAVGELLAGISRIGSNQGLLTVDTVVLEVLQVNDQVFIQNGFTIINASSDQTIFDIPTSEELVIRENNQDRITVNNNVILEADNDVRLAPDIDIDLIPSGDIIMNPTGEIKVFDDLDMDGVNTIDMGTSTTVPVGSATGAFNIKLNGVIKRVKFYDF